MRVCSKSGCLRSGTSGPRCERGCIGGRQGIRGGQIGGGVHFTDKLSKLFGDIERGSARIPHDPMFHIHLPSSIYCSSRKVVNLRPLICETRISVSVSRQRFSRRIGTAKSASTRAELLITFATSSSSRQGGSLYSRRGVRMAMSSSQGQGNHASSNEDVLSESKAVSLTSVSTT
jgi:hypothetical protein